MSAIVSPCGLFRVRLDRDVQPDGIVAALIGVNPSTADATKNDPTIRKDIGFAKANGWRKIIKGNVFSFRATDVKELGRTADPVGPDNMEHLKQIIADADLLVPCWGDTKKVPRSLRYRFAETMTLLLDSGKPVKVFGYTKGGDPLHTLMLAYSTPLRPVDKPL